MLTPYFCPLGTSCMRGRNRLRHSITVVSLTCLTNRFTWATGFSSHNIEAAWSLGELGATVPNGGFSETLEANSVPFEQPSGTTILENHMPLANQFIPDHSLSLQSPRKFPQFLTSVISDFTFRSISGHDDYRAPGQGAFQPTSSEDVTLFKITLKMSMLQLYRPPGQAASGPIALLRRAPTQHPNVSRTIFRTSTFSH